MILSPGDLTKIIGQKFTQTELFLQAGGLVSMILGLNDLAKIHGLNFSQTERIFLMLGK